MPQMSPLSWLFLYFIFSIIFIFIVIFNYYNFIYLPNKFIYTSKKSNKINWKW